MTYADTKQQYLAKQDSETGNIVGLTEKQQNRHALPLPDPCPTSLPSGSGIYLILVLATISWEKGKDNSYHSTYTNQDLAPAGSGQSVKFKVSTHRTDRSYEYHVCNTSGTSELLL